MASKVKASTALFLCLYLLFFALVSSHTSDGSRSSATNSKNPVVIRPGATYPAGINPEGHGQIGNCNPLNLGVCAKLLGGLVDVELGNVPTQPCCSLIHGLVDLEAAVCLCTAIRANVLGIINLELPISLSLLLSNCGRNPAVEYLCSP